MNDENLIPFNERSEEEVRAMNRKGGINSGKARRRKADLRKAMQEAMQTTFTDKKGRRKTGEEMVIAGIIANLSDPHARNWGRALDALLLLTGQNMTKEQIAKIKAETELTKARTKAIQQDGGSLADIEALSPLANLLRGETNDEDSND